MDIQRELKNDLTSISGVVELQDGIYLPLEQVEKILVKRLEQVKKLTITDVSGSALLSKAKQMQLEQQHKIDSYTEYYTESEIGILNGVKRIVSLIERHYR